MNMEKKPSRDVVLMDEKSQKKYVLEFKILSKIMSKQLYIVNFCCSNLCQFRMRNLLELETEDFAFLILLFHFKGSQLVGLVDYPMKVAERNSKHPAFIRAGVR